MQPIWGVLVAVAVFLVILHLRNRRRRPPAPKQYSRSIEGAQVVAFLHPRVSRGCLMDHGLQFGKGFRRKQGPALPHDAECRCRPVPFSHSSSAVFNGALRNPVPPITSIQDLPEEEALLLLESLKAGLDQKLPDTAEAYAAQADLTRFEANRREALSNYLRERYHYVREQQGN